MGIALDTGPEAHGAKARKCQSFQFNCSLSKTDTNNKDLTTPSLWFQFSNYLLLSTNMSFPIT